MSDRITNDNPSLSAIIMQAITNALKDVHTAMPGIIESFDPVKQTASVRPAIKRIFKEENEDGSETTTEVELPLLINVPVIFPRGGGFFLTFPIASGDECLVFFNERSIDIWNNDGGVQGPGAWRMHDLSDGICFVGIGSQPNKISAFDADNVQLRNNVGDVTVTLKPDKNIVVETPLKVTVDAPDSQFTGNVEIDGTLDVHDETTLDKSCDVGENVIAGIQASAPTVAAASSLTISGLEMGTHKHSQGSDSNGDSEVDTGGPHA